jgi:hypothetical protein
MNGDANVAKGVCVSTIKYVKVWTNWTCFYCFQQCLFAHQ